MDSKKDIKNKRWLCKWGRIRTGGVFLYIIRKAIFWMPPLLILKYLSDSTFFNENHSPWVYQLHSLFFWPAIAVFFSLFCLSKWLINENKYKQLGSKYPLSAIN